MSYPIGTQSENMSPTKRERFPIAPLGEYYKDLLLIDSWINDRSMAMQANSLLCSKLQEREDRIQRRVEYLARKRGMSTDELWKAILKGEATRIDSSEISDDFDD